MFNNSKIKIEKAKLIARNKKKRKLRKKEERMNMKMNLLLKLG
jgi:hypothetical protein